MTFRAIVPLLCGGVLLLSGAIGAGASEYNGPVNFAQAAPAPATDKNTCAYNRDRKMCGGTCPRKEQRCQKITVNYCMCK
jgi:hypothetical protein